MSVLAPPPAPVREDPEALIEEARRRTRRRRLRGGGIAVVLIGGIAALAFFAGSGGSGGIVTETAGRPFVNVRAFSHDGKLAFISRGSLWVLDGAAGSLRRVAVTTYTKGFKTVSDLYGHTTRVPEATPVVPGSPTFSHDGRWLAYLVTPQTGNDSPSQLWIARADGTDARRVGHLTVDQLVGWSPTADGLAVTTETPEPFLYFDAELATKLLLVRPDGASRTLAAVSATRSRPVQIEDAAWSPDGRAVAASLTDGGVRGGGTTVRAYPVSGGRPTTWFSIATRHALPGADCGTPSRSCNQVIADLAGWWRGWGIGFWVYADGMSRDNDGASLAVLSAPGAQPRPVATTLSDGVTDAVAAGPGGSLAVVASTTGGRDLGQGKVVESCDTHTHACAPLPGGSTWTGPDRDRCTYPAGAPCSAPPTPGTAGSAVSLDPAWSPTAPLLAYVKAPYTFDPALPWYAAHELFLWSARSGSTRMLADVSGPSAPTWSHDGRDLLYVSNDGLWLAPVGSGKPVEIEHPLFPEQQWNTIGTTATISYYGQIPWTGQFSWSSP